MKTCIVCGKQLIGNQRMFCSRACQLVDRNIHDRPLVLHACSNCGKEHISRRPKEISVLCKSCAGKQAATKRNCVGENNPGWRGGHHGWQAGKFGKDKDGLSWKKQRQLAWERDGYSCTIPGCTHKLRGKPDVHHIKPYRLCQSHALDNLVCLCPHHHKQAEAQIKELWGGHVFCGFPRINKKPTCKKCNARAILYDGLCKQDWIKSKVLPVVHTMRSKGLSYHDIGKFLNVDCRAVMRWVQCVCGGRLPARLYAKFVDVETLAEQVELLKPTCVVQTKRPVVQILPDGNEVKFPSLLAAAKATSCNSGAIYECCRGGVRKTHHGFTWRFLR